MPRISSNPITMEEVQATKMSNLQMDRVVGMEELMGEDGNFEENGTHDNLLTEQCSGIVRVVEKTSTWGTTVCCKLLK